MDEVENLLLAPGCECLIPSPDPDPHFPPELVWGVRVDHLYPGEEGRVLASSSFPTLCVCVGGWGVGGFGEVC